jgi:hypothetical protein
VRKAGQYKLFLLTINHNTPLYEHIKVIILNKRAYELFEVTQAESQYIHLPQLGSNVHGLRCDIVIFLGSMFEVFLVFSVEIIVIRLDPTFRTSRTIQSHPFQVKQYAQ